MPSTNKEKQKNDFIKYKGVLYKRHSYHGKFDKTKHPDKTFSICSLCDLEPKKITNKDDVCIPRNVYLCIFPYYLKKYSVYDMLSDLNLEEQ